MESKTSLAFVAYGRKVSEPPWYERRAPGWLSSQKVWRSARPKSEPKDSATSEFPLVFFIAYGNEVSELVLQAKLICWWVHLSLFDPFAGLASAGGHKINLTDFQFQVTANDDPLPLSACPSVSQLLVISPADMRLSLLSIPIGCGVLSNILGITI